MDILMVVAHPRQRSLTRAVAEAFTEAASRNGHSVEWADLAAEGFDPVLREQDEPDWNDSNKIYSADVRREMARVERNEATVMVFPVWWWSMPALLKGWIDRVWNNGWAYGDKTYPHQRVLMIGVAGNGQADYVKRGYDSAMETAIDLGILGYCAISERRLELLYGSMEGDEGVARIVDRARELGRTF
ncbi:MAG: NAD(P)H oxidoreductase [Hyphomicrobium sp.]|nr:NAD(P)H oxidoreductase [Hyphomicrobium sp.]